ncbi:HAMP domain-containing sensor histidine kinase [Uliginosibacterium sp. 31-16]|uniref:sensor histidine kinase n=1 Tax=Uliginosibacterium sp. 31-16 TaxID=3068315 RepID=UPI00273FDA5C|nr:HAMP domain-containing sensor histidine kinase [Uliginosibacterium sp. 31-16]MDP5240639.1 HAMP domain-containing sensor histidine kinase [Uliginosibacterium sp. 31-16]
MRSVTDWKTMTFASLGLRAKLVLIFVAIKVVPLVLLAWLAWSAAHQLALALGTRATGMADNMVGAIREVGDKVTTDAIHALDDRSREGIERLTTDIARSLAAFLYDRDNDIRSAALLEPGEAAYGQFLQGQVREHFVHGAWKLAADGSKWEPVVSVKPDPATIADAHQALPDNARSFSARPPEYLGERALRPLYLEMSFIDLTGRERFKVASTGKTLVPGLRDISQRQNTFVKAENYWPELKLLKPGDIYVSEVIGAYVGSHVVGPYTPVSAQKAGIAYAPELSAYAGTENPLGRRFQGIVRWATPVVRGGRIMGYVSLALDHDHIRQFTDRISPTDARYTPIIDAIAGNYAFIWDHKSRSIAHPRDYMIVGYDPATGEQVPPWVDQKTYASWTLSGLSWAEYSRGLVPFKGQSLQLKPAPEQIKAGTLGLDCRYLNFSPQCSGWNQLTEKGGSGSFEINFSGLHKLTTAAAIPYYTGQYGKSPQGFGFVTIGANVADFHRAATESARQIGETIAEKDRAFQQERQSMLDTVGQSIRSMALSLAWSTLAMICMVIGIAYWMAGFITRQIRNLVSGIRRFETGDLSRRFEVHSHDEMGELSEALNRMADSVEESFRLSEEAREKAEDANRTKSDFLASVSHELRTPLNGILGFAELLELDLQDPMQREHALTIKSSGRHLLGVVNDLLDLAKAESGKMLLHPEPIDLAPFVGDVVQVHRAHAATKRLDFHLDLGQDGPLPVIQADPVRLRQMINNLINNAIKYTDAGSVRVAVESVGTEVYFEVSDTGCGIPPEHQLAVFEKFGWVGGKIQRDKGGTGLGLSLVRNLACLMGGRILLESELGKGSIFTLVIPVCAPRSADPDPDDESDDAQNDLRTLT